MLSRVSPGVTVVRAEHADTGTVRLLCVLNDVPEALFDRIGAEESAVLADNLELVKVVADNDGDVPGYGWVWCCRVPIVR